MRWIRMLWLIALTFAANSPLARAEIPRQPGPMDGTPAGKSRTPADAETDRMPARSSRPLSSTPTSTERQTDSKDDIPALQISVVTEVWDGNSSRAGICPASQALLMARPAERLIERLPVTLSPALDRLHADPPPKSAEQAGLASRYPHAPPRGI